MMALSPAERSKLIGILGMLGSDFPGERANAGSLATKLVREHGLTWDDVVLLAVPNVQQTPRQHRPTGEAAVRFDIRFCQQHLDKLNSWECDFVHSLAGRRKTTGGQVAKLKQIAADLRMRGCA